MRREEKKKKTEEKIRISAYRLQLPVCWLKCFGSMPRKVSYGVDYDEDYDDIYDDYDYNSDVEVDGHMLERL
ncbi:hypothetical protein MRB53_015472 [Persea americana]|uniref:Uncharacterized protein n=1 Tax=Persea americana TaxID=3435 RepID=A0ACC2M009_PERAE|nr:hypothetical protein MRB53_015472 [Persea americana]